MQYERPMGGKFARSAPPADVVIWHNPRCTKSRQTLELLRQRGVEPEVRKYLEDPPSAAELAEVLERLGMGPRDLLRKKEAPYRELGLGDPARTDEDIIAAMAGAPILIERPVVVRGDRAVLGRPPENVTALFEG